MKPVRYEFEPVIYGWGICLGRHGKWHVLFGDAEKSAVKGTYRKRRRAKKEITHYIKYGASWCQHGMRKRIAASLQQGGAA